MDFAENYKENNPSASFTNVNQILSHFMALTNIHSKAFQIAFVSHLTNVINREV